MEALTILAELPFHTHGEEGERPKSVIKEMEYESVLVAMTVGADSGLESDNSDANSVSTENTEVDCVPTPSPFPSPSLNVRSCVPPAPPPPPLPYYLRGIPAPPPPPPIPAHLQNIRGVSLPPAGIPKPPPPPPRPRNSMGIPDPPPPPPLPAYLTDHLPVPHVRRPTPVPPRTFVHFPELDDYDSPDTDDTDWTDDDDYYVEGPSPAEITPVQEYAECTVCLSVEWAPSALKCCGKKVCKDCMKQMVTTNIDSGIIEMSCPHPGCDGYLSYNDVRVILKTDQAYWEKYVRFCDARSESETEKVCPRCATLTVHKVPRRLFGPREADVKVTCSKCSLEWCFYCHCPWHDGVSCKQHQNGDKEFKQWIKGRNGKGVSNGHHCPSCKIPIQRSTGCDHMTCSECQTHFCYSCGRRHRSIIGFGDHYDGMSVFGCPKYYRGKPGTHEAVRYGYVGAKIASGMAYPPLFVAGVGVLAVCAAVALPIYGGVKLYKRVKHQKQQRRQREARRGHNRPQRARDRRRPIAPDLDAVDEEFVQQYRALPQRRSSASDEEDMVYEIQQDIGIQELGMFVDRETAVFH